MAIFLEDKFPELRGHITGGDYPAPPIAELLTHVLSALQLIGIIWMVLGGDKLLRMLPFYKTGPLPAFYWTIQDNPVPLAIGLYFAGPAIDWQVAVQWCL